MILVRVHEHDHPVSHRVEDFPCAIGRSMHAQIRIDEQTVSGRHAEIRRDGDALVLVDLGSTNGILEGGKRVQELRLTANVTVHFGDVRVELIVEEQLSPTKLSRPAKARLPASARTAVPKVMAAVILSYVAVCLVPASDRYKEYWPPERPYEILGSALAIWLALLGMAFVISLFCKINSKRFRFHQVMALMSSTYLLGYAFHAFAPTLIFNLHNVAVAPFLLHFGYGALAFGFFFTLQTYAFNRWSTKLRGGVALGIALAVMLLVEIYVDARRGFGDHERMAELGLGLVNPANVGKSTEDLLFGVALSIAETDQKRIRMLERLEAEAEAGD